MPIQLAMEDQILEEVTRDAEDLEALENEIGGSSTAGNKWHFFLSHTQQNGDAKTLASTLFYEMKDRGYQCWLDVMMPKQDGDAMREGVENSEIVLAIITGGDDTKLRCTPICGSNPRMAE